jgi:hypothetical protein
MRNLLFFGFLSLSLCVFAQVPTQTVRGKVFDNETNYPLYGVKVEINVSENSSFRAASTEEGNFEIKNVPVGVAPP